VKALVTGAASGIGHAIAERLRAEGHDVAALDVAELDVSDPAAWSLATAGLDRLDIACLNAGVITGTTSIADVSDEQYRRILGINVGGTVLGVRALLPALEAAGGKVVVTASLACLTTMPTDPIYAGTKHFLVGFVRSVAPQLEPIRINAVCPGPTDTSMLEDQRDAFEAASFPLLTPRDVAAAVWLAATSEASGEAWWVQPGREPATFRFPNVPGPRREGARVGPPPL